MNKNLWILGVAAVSMMASCSSNDDFASLLGKPGIVVDNSNVEIRLASSSGGTRASIESSENGLFEADGLGIFCLANNAQGVNPAELDITWVPTWNPDTEFAVWMNNVEANAEYNEDATATEINWVDGVKRFYPVANWYTYQFYGYYPRVEGESYENGITYDTNRIEAHIPIDGKQDVIWGRTRNDHELAYSARYFRQPAFADETPEWSLSTS